MINPGDTLQAGRAYWIYSKSASASLELTANSATTSSRTSYAYTSLFEEAFSEETESSLLTARRADTWTERYQRSPPR